MQIVFWSELGVWVVFLDRSVMFYGFYCLALYLNGSSATSLMLLHSLTLNSLGWASLSLIYCSKAVWKHNGCNTYFGLKETHWESFAARGNRSTAWWPMVCFGNKIYRLSHLLFQNKWSGSAQTFFANLQIISSLFFPGYIDQLQFWKINGASPLKIAKGSLPSACLGSSSINGSFEV